MKVGIIGAGLTGLTAAYKLAKQGHQVTIWEKEHVVGGQVATFPIGDSYLERFYHHIFMGDKELRQLLAELGLSSRLVWLPSRVGYYYGGRIHPFTTPIDLLRFSPLGLADRVRLGLASLYLQRSTHWQRWEGVTAREWLERAAGRRSYKVVWEPLLRGKFGNSTPEIGMAWVWGRLRVRLGSRRGLGQEYLGYLRGSFGMLNEALAQRIREAGARLNLGTPVQRVVVQGGMVAGVQTSSSGEVFPLDAVVATVPSPVFLQIVPELPAAYRDRLAQARYLAALCLVLVLGRSLTPVYWLNIGDPSFPFVATIEHTNYVSPAEYGGRHILYVSNYLPGSSSLLGMEPMQLLQHYLPYLQRFNPQFDTSWVKEYHLFMETDAQPIVTAHYTRLIPSVVTPIPGLYLANTTQVYPEDRGLNQALRLGMQAADLVIHEGEGA